MKFTIGIPNVQPSDIEYHVDLLRMLKHKVLSWSWIHGVLHVRCEKPRYRVKMRFANMAVRMNHHPLTRFNLWGLRRKSK